jgi:hypothetical protein
VQTILPELKIRVAVFGDLSLNTRPGNWSGWYSTSGKICVIRLRLTVWFTVAEATTFSILTMGLVCGICGFIKALYIYLLATILQRN